MYIIVLTFLLAIILFRKGYQLFKNKRNSSTYQDIDEELIIMINEGDSIG
ncbi:hypothetical protein [Bacillus sp. JJ1764]